MRRQGKLHDARERLLVCGDASCPALVREDCAQRLVELDTAQPTLILDIRDGDMAADVDAVSVTMDGQPLAAGLTTIAADPGEHSFWFEVPGRPRVSRVFILKEGEKDRRERIDIGPASVAPSSIAPPPPAQESPEVVPTTPSGSWLDAQRLLGLTAALLGAGGIVAGIDLGLGARAALDAQNRDCASPTVCPRHAQALSDHDTMETDGLWSTVAFVAGGALVAGGLALIFVDPLFATATVGVTAVPEVGLDRAGISLQGRF